MEKKNISFISHNEYFEIIFTGERDFNATGELLDIILLECQKADHKRILLDISGATGQYRGFDRYKLAEKGSGIFDFSYKILVIEKIGTVDKFGENTAVNRGANVLVTSDRGNGLKWLLGE